MNKAILVIDIPETCEKCVLNSNNNGRPDCCKILWKPVNYLTRREDCPLKPLPDKVKVFMDDWADGYNACLEDILGE